MYEALKVLSLLLQAATWLLLLGFGVWSYRRLRLRSIPWLGAYALLAMPLGLVTPPLLGAIADRGGLPGGWSPGEFLRTWISAETALRGLIGLLLALMVVSEIAGLLVRLCPGSERGIPSLLLAVRERPALLGVPLLALTLAGPVAAVLLWLAGPASTAAGPMAGGG
jgi:hypothetical protein